ncbi:hypothetical protein I6A84_17315, partial [Frankia sp. CNm7]|uniref:WD40 repeat domain-containing protein n=1 Tax=Frankia nepalensis TaxID=1836974 RepID=UPI001D44BCE9|nr:hypothetical protein [Frankia nepalensis]
SGSGRNPDRSDWDTDLKSLPPMSDRPAGPPAARAAGQRGRRRLTIVAALAGATAAAVPAIVLAAADRDTTAAATGARPSGMPLTGPTSASAPVSTAAAGSTPAPPPGPTTAELLTGTAPRRAGEIRTGSVSDVALSADSGTLVTGLFSGAIEFWHLNGSTPEPIEQRGDGLVSTVPPVVALSPDGDTFAHAAEGGKVLLWDVIDPAEPATATPLGDAPLASTVNILDFSPDGRVLVTSHGDDGAIRLWDVTHPAAPTPLGGPFADSVFDVAFSPDGRVLAVGHADGTVRLWNIAKPAAPSPLGDPVDAEGGERVVFSADGRLLATFGGPVRFWDVSDAANPRPVGRPISEVPSNGGFDMALSPDGSVLATAEGAEGTVRLWDIRDLDRPVRIGEPITGHAQGSALLAFTPDGATLVAAGNHDNLLVWRLR